MQKPISAGTVISRRYQIQKKIHDNTFNSCYLAEDSENSNRLVTLSLPRIELLILPDFIPTFDEVCMKLMSHSFQGLLKVQGYGEHNSHPYVVLQYVADETLEHVLSRKRVSESKVDMDSVLDWATPLAVTLDELHSSDYVHGSLKPSSIYIGSQKILMGDFITEYTLQSMGKFKNGITTLNVDQYLSPEYLKSSYTANYDQYLLATVVYEALAGKVPFARTKGGDDYRMQVATHVSPLLTAHRPELKAVSDVLAKAMKRKPTDRYKSCRDFISKLQEAQSAEPAKPPPQKRVVITTPFSDDPEEEEEEIITSIRRNDKGSGGKKGLFWLGAFLLTGGAAAFTAVNYPHLIGLGDKQPVLSSSEEKPAVVPVSIAPVVGVSKPKLVEEQVDVVEVASQLATAEPSAEPVKPVEDAPQVELAENLDSAEKLLDEVQQESNETTALADDTLAELDRVVSQALDVGFEEFTTEKATETAETAQHAALDAAVTQALLKGRDDYMSQAAIELFDSSSDETQEAAVEVVAEAEVLSAVSEPVATVEPPVETVVEVEADSEPDAEQAVEQVVDPTVAEAPVVDPAAALKAQRERNLVIKQQKIARIKSITDDCTIGGKIHREVAAGNLPYVKNCMSVGVEANLKQNNGWSLLHIAARTGNLNICKLLIAKGATVNAKANNGQTPLAMAIALRQDRVVSYLKTRGAVVN